MENVILGILNNPVYSGYLDLLFICSIIYLWVKGTSLDEKVERCQFDQKDDIKDIKEKITNIENNISTINQNLIELAKGQ